MLSEQHKLGNALVIRPTDKPGMVCVVTGLGLLGESIARQFSKYDPGLQASGVNCQLDWSTPAAVNQVLLELLGDDQTDRVEIIWCAGRAGFLSPVQELDAEYELFVNAITALREKYGTSLSVNLLSSAGGVYEGAAFTSQFDEVQPLRAYGISKLRQEQFLANIGVSARIYRLSSAYGPPRTGQRAGLLNVLLQRVRDGGVAEVYASPFTLRDYIYTGDIARYVVDGIIDERNPGKHILASGRPTSVDSLVKLISSVARRKVRVQYRNAQENSANIVFSKSLLPDDFIVSPLEETIRLLLAHNSGDDGDAMTGAQSR